MKYLISISLRILVNSLVRRPPGDGIPAAPERYGLRAADPVCRRRLEGIFRSFFTGVESAVRRPRSPLEPPASVEPFYHPFYWEGTAMGQSFAHWLLFRRRVPLFDQRLTLDDPFAFMKAVGIGFSLSFLRPRSAKAVSKAACALGNLGLLVPDGFGFGAGLFRWPGSVDQAVKQLPDAPGDIRLSMLNGLGRSLWFHYVDRVDEALERVCATDVSAPLLGGMGLAAAFTFTDDLSRAYGVASRLAAEESRAFLKGVRIALFVRHWGHPGVLAALLEAQEPAIRARAENDIEKAKAAHEATWKDPRYVACFHEHCLGSSQDQG